MDTFSIENIKGWLGTILFHLILILLLIFTTMVPFQSKRESPALEGIPVMFGNVQDAFGDDEPFGRGDGTSTANVDLSVPDPNIEQIVSNTKPTPATSPSTENVHTQTTEPTVNVKNEAEKRAAEEKRKAEAIEAAKKREEVEAARKAQAQADEAKNIANSVGGMFGNGTGNGSHGNTQGTGSQGSTMGNSNTGATSGIGGWGSYALNKRRVGSEGLVKPTYNVNDYGKVVVDILVDPKGNVISASVGAGTNTSNTTLKNAAVRAAQRTKFQADPKAVTNQKGTITYDFSLF
ncbi:cell envelope integrity protein TolA [Dysgonomonas sp. 520]|uniref:cell envelope integrity protein TolA n=1 Tax=Dysgonomonas sp. 520 TaxID=2302931 RepID=UPI0013D19962|nr:cell envelope integrity protein TolA [Dysgonomonas sp. 520]NDW10024.1 TonB family protein [Dysgonomonas sp. 520]